MPSTFSAGENMQDDCVNRGPLQNDRASSIEVQGPGSSGLQSIREGRAWMFTGFHRTRRTNRTGSMDMARSEDVQEKQNSLAFIFIICQMWFSAGSGRVAELNCSHVRCDFQFRISNVEPLRSVRHKKSTTMRRNCLSWLVFMAVSCLFGVVETYSRCECSPAPGIPARPCRPIPPMVEVG